MPQSIAPGLGFLAAAAGHLAGVGKYPCLGASGFLNDLAAIIAVIFQVLPIDPQAAVGAEISGSGNLSANVLAIGQGEPKVDRLPVHRRLVAHTGSGIGLSPPGEHPAGAGGVVELTDAIPVGLSGEVQSIVQYLLPQVFRHLGALRHVAHHQAAQVKVAPQIRTALAHHLGKVLLQGPHHRRRNGVPPVDLHRIGRAANPTQAQGGGVHNHPHRPHGLPLVQKAVGHRVAHQAAVARPIPSPHRHFVFCCCVHRRGKIQRILQNSRAGGIPHRLAVQPNFHTAGIDGIAIACSGRHPEGKIRIGDFFRPTIQVGFNGGGMFTNGRRILICQFCRIGDGKHRHRHRPAAVFDVQGKCVLPQGQGRSIIPPVSRQVRAVISGIGVA